MNAHRPTRSDNVGRVGDAVVCGIGRFTAKRIGLIAIALVALATNAGTAWGDWEQTHKVTANDAATYDGFGRSVSISGDTAVIGAAWDVGVDKPGSAYVFRYDGTGWVEEAKLLAFDGAENDFFGGSVSISGDTAVIGAWGDDDNGTYSGSAYVFRYDGTGWVEEAKLLPSDGAADDWFGSSVSICGDTAVIGAHGDDDNGFRSGSAYVFRRYGMSWVEQAKLLLSEGEAGDNFGLPVSISGDSAVIGAYGDDDNGYCSGSAYVFRYDGTGWAEEAKLLPSDGAAYEYFGHSVSICGDSAVIGAYGDDDNGTYSGSVYVFRYDGTGWVEEAKLLPSDGAGYDFFGTSVSIFRDTVIIGAEGDHENAVYSGSAYVFRYDDTGWVEEAKLLASDGAGYDFFGTSVSISGDTVVIGADGDDDNGSESGSAYIFERVQCPADFDGDGDVNGGDLAILLEHWGTDGSNGGDVDGNGIVDTTDLLALLAAWGEYP